MLPSGFHWTPISGKAGWNSERGCWISRLGHYVFLWSAWHFSYLGSWDDFISGWVFSLLLSLSSTLTFIRAWASFLHSGAKIKSKYWQNIGFTVTQIRNSRKRKQRDFIAPPTTSTPTRLPQYLLISFTSYKFLIWLPTGLPCRAGSAQLQGPLLWTGYDWRLLLLHHGCQCGFIYYPILTDCGICIVFALANVSCFVKVAQARGEKFKQYKQVV